MYVVSSSVEKRVNSIITKARKYGKEFEKHFERQNAWHPKHSILLITILGIITLLGALIMLKKICKFLRRKLGTIVQIRRKGFGLLSVILGLLLIFIATGITIKAFNKANTMVNTLQEQLNSKIKDMETASQGWHNNINK